MRYRRKRNLVVFRKIYRFFVRTFKLESKIEKDLIQEQAFINISKIISKLDSKLSISPETNFCYVEWNNYFIKFNENSAVITNGKFSYYIWLSTNKSDKLKNKFNREIESRIKKSEDCYKHNTLNNLKEITNQLK